MGKVFANTAAKPRLGPPAACRPGAVRRSSEAVKVSRMGRARAMPIFNDRGGRLGIGLCPSRHFVHHITLDRTPKCIPPRKYGPNSVRLAPPGNRWGAPDSARAVRGGSWNNNTAGARASSRNRNTINNRNNNLGVRLLCSVHVPLRTRMPICPADYGLPGAAGMGGWRGCVPSARPGRRANIKQRHPPGRCSAGPRVPRLS
jgi:hypothetical protein